MGAIVTIKKFTLPQYPIVRAEGTAIVIVEEDHHEWIWGYEPTAVEALDAVKEIEIGLRAIRFIKLSLSNCMNEIVEELIQFDIPQEYVEQYVFEAYRGILRLMMKLRRETSNH
jgi:hypothetical protein